MGFTLADKQAGPFRLEVAWIKAVKGWRPEDLGRLGRFESFEESRDYVLTAVRPENRAAAAEAFEQAFLGS